MIMKMGMEINTNYYDILNVSKDCDIKDIKKSYYKLSKELHPDVNKDTDVNRYQLIIEAYTVLSGSDRETYDKKSIYGSKYDEYNNLFDVDMNIDYEQGKTSFNNFKKNEILDIIINIDDNFDGSLKYDRWVTCKSCSGSGKDLKSKIVIKDENGKILRTFEAEDGCDFCEGSGKNEIGENCNFCFGVGRVGMNTCSKCLGERRILGKQKLKGIKMIGDEMKIVAMGHHSKNDVGRVGHLILKRS